MLDRPRFLEKVERWLPPEIERVYAILDNLRALRPSTPPGARRATDVRLFALAHPRVEYNAGSSCSSKYAAYLNHIEPWGRVLR